MIHQLISLVLLQRKSDRRNVAFMNKHCCDTPRYDVCYIQLMSKTCGYDLINKAEKPKNGEIQVMDQKGLLVIMSAVMKLSGYC